MANRLRTLGLFVALTALFVAVGYGIGTFFLGSPVLGSLVFLVVAAAINFVSYFWSDRIVLWSTKARIVSRDEAPRLHRIVANLVLRADMPMPRIAIIPSHQPNAFATGRNPKNAVVAATEGIMHMLDDEELAGVMAHELAHIRHRDILTMSAAATVAGAITFAARMFFWTSLFGGGGGDRDNQGGILGSIALIILAPIAAMLVQMAISRSREYAADRGGAEISGNPRALARALRTMEQGVKRIPMETGTTAQAHMYIVNPFRGGIGSWFSTHPPTDERVRRLEAMVV